MVRQGKIGFVIFSKKAVYIWSGKVRYDLSFSLRKLCIYLVRQGKIGFVIFSKKAVYIWSGKVRYDLSFSLRKLYIFGQAR